MTPRPFVQPGERPPLRQPVRPPFPSTDRRFQKPTVTTQPLPSRLPGSGMTLCIAAILKGENSIALVSDQLVSNGFTSAEGFRKDYLLEWGRWVALCEAKEARRVPMLMEAMEKQL